MDVRDMLAQAESRYEAAMAAGRTDKAFQAGCTACDLSDMLGIAPQDMGKAAQAGLRFYAAHKARHPFDNRADFQLARKLGTTR